MSKAEQSRMMMGFNTNHIVSEKVVTKTGIFNDYECLEIILENGRNRRIEEWSIDGKEFQGAETEFINPLFDLSEQF